MPKVKVVIGIPTEGNTQCEPYLNRLLFAFHLGVLQTENSNDLNKPQFEFYWASTGKIFTPMAREIIVDKALKIGADYVFMIDDDMLAKPDVFEQLYKHNVDVVAALAFTRNPPHLPVIYTQREGWDPVASREFVVTEWVTNYPKNKLVQCDAVGFGAVLIKMDVIKKMEIPYFMSSTGTGEDILFCLKARKAGAKIFMDTSVKLGHVGAPVIIDEERFAEFNKPEEIEKTYGAYKKYDVWDVQHAELSQPANKELVLSGRD